MRKTIPSVLFGLSAVAGVALALTAGEGDSLAAGPVAPDMVVLGEEDLADRAEILRNMYRRITPPEIPLVQDVGTWPAAWEEFGANWASAAADREYGAWVVPVEVSQDAGSTVVKDGNGALLWRGWTDFARPESADVVLTGGLVAEEDWDAYEAVRGAVAAMTAEPSRVELPGRTRTSPTNGLRFTSHEWTSNDTFRLELAYEIDTNVDVFAYAVACTSSLVVATWTNDENQVITDTNIVWTSVGLPFNGLESDWELRGTVAIGNGVAEFEDSGFSEELSRLRFYAAVVAQDSDGDGLNDGMEIFVSHTDPHLTDTDGDGIDDAAEYAVDSNPSRSNVWWMATTTNEIRYRAYMGNQSSWPDTPYQQFETNVVSSLTNCVRILKDVRIDGYVDDIIRIDSFEVNENQGPKSFTNQSITNVSPFLDCGSLDLTLYDCPAHGHSGHNEIRLGDTNNNPFRVMWDWQVPIDIRMEPIWTSEILPLDNPSGVILGSNAWFHVDVFPEGVVPEENIVWTSLSNKLSFVTTNRGARVQVRGDALGEDALRVEVEGAEGDFGLPDFHVKVMPLMLVTAKVGVVVNANGDWVAQSNRIATVISDANAILIQAGKQIVVDGDYVPIPELTGYWDVDLSSNFVNQLRATLSNPGGMEIYFVNSITGINQESAGGANSPNGMLISTMGTGRTLAHETCHACLLKDIYEMHVGTSLIARGEIREEWLPEDWGRYAPFGLQNPDIWYFMRRLLMYGYALSNKGDIPAHTVFGLARYNVEPLWRTDDVFIGLSGFLQNPIHN